jgi:hypothetical protein
MTNSSARKFSGVRIRIGAAYDDVSVIEDGVVKTTFDRHKMRKEGHREDQGVLRRAVVDAWEQRNTAKAKRNKRRAYKQKDRENA